jgi:hypothetical protein
MSDAEISSLIAQISALMDLKLDTGGTNALVLKSICALWTSFRVFLKDPSSQKLGEYSGDRSFALKMIRDELDDLIQVAGGGASFRYGFEFPER